jgi:hypothetical protein
MFATFYGVTGIIDGFARDPISLSTVPSAIRAQPRRLDGKTPESPSEAKEIRYERLHLQILALLDPPHLPVRAAALPERVLSLGG